MFTSPQNRKEAESTEYWKGVGCEVFERRVKYFKYFCAHRQYDTGQQCHHPSGFGPDEAFCKKHTWEMDEQNKGQEWKLLGNKGEENNERN